MKIRLQTRELQSGPQASMKADHNDYAASKAAIMTGSDLLEPSTITDRSKSGGRVCLPLSAAVCIIWLVTKRQDDFKAHGRLYVSAGTNGLQLSIEERRSGGSARLRTLKIIAIGLCPRNSRRKEARSMYRDHDVFPWFRKSLKDFRMSCLSDGPT